MLQRGTSVWTGCLALAGFFLAAASLDAGEALVTTRLFMPRHILIQGRVGPLEGYFALDSGSPINIPTPLTLGQILGNAIEGKPGIPVDIAIEGKVFNLKFNKEMPGLGDRLAKIYPEIPVLGILGSGFLRQYTVRIDYIEQTFSLYDPESLPLPGERELGPEFLLTDFIYGEQKCIVLDIAMGEGDRLKGRVGFDLGATRFEFPARLGAENGFPEGLIPTMRIGGMTWTDVPTMYTRNVFDEPSFKRVGIIGLLGNEQLFNTVVTLYHKEMKLSIRRDTSREPGPALEAFGLKVASNGKVTFLKEDSRASISGLQAGDVLKVVDDRPVRGAMEIRSAFRFHDGKDPFTFVVRRGEAEVILGGALPDARKEKQ